MSNGKSKADVNFFTFKSTALDDIGLCKEVALCVGFVKRKLINRSSDCEFVGFAVCNNGFVELGSFGCCFGGLSCVGILVTAAGSK